MGRDLQETSQQGSGRDAGRWPPRTSPRPFRARLREVIPLVNLGVPTLVFAEGSRFLLPHFLDLAVSLPRRLFFRPFAIFPEQLCEYFRNLKHRPIVQGANVALEFR